MNISALIGVNVMYIILSLIVFAVFIWLYNQNRDEKSPIDLLDLVTINGKLSDRKLIRFSTWLVSSWGFIYLIVDNSLTEWYFAFYMGTWVANALISNSINKDRDMPRSSSRSSSRMRRSGRNTRNDNDDEPMDNPGFREGM